MCFLKPQYYPMSCEPYDLKRTSLSLKPQNSWEKKNKKLLHDLQQQFHLGKIQYELYLGESQAFLLCV